MGGSVPRSWPVFPPVSLRAPSYRPMHHEDFKEDLEEIPHQERTWAGGEESKREMYSRLKKL